MVPNYGHGARREPVWCPGGARRTMIAAKERAMPVSHSTNVRPEELSQLV